jgi:ABC-2 type transport system ATP-binding protein
MYADYYTVADNIELFRTLYDRFDEEIFLKLANKFGLGNRIDSKYSILSRGQKVKADIAFAIAVKPKYIIPDEPYAGLDEVSKQDITEILQSRVSEDNVGIFISTHIIDEIEDVADFIVMMKDGKIVKSGDRDSVIGIGKTLTEETIDFIEDEEI